MCIINAGYPFPPGNIQAGQDGVEVNCTDRIHFFKQQKEKQTDIIFSVKNL